jgi:hypothetical protein
MENKSTGAHMRNDARKSSEIAEAQGSVTA